MDIKEIFAGIKEKVVSLYEAVKEWALENKTVAIISASLIALILICLILLINISSKDKKNKKAEVLEPIVLTETPMNPEGPVIQKGYNYTRKTEKNWSEEEVTEWFTVPSEKEIESLSKANDSMVNEIIGAAP